MLAECSHPALLLCLVIKDRQERNLPARWSFVQFRAVFCPNSYLKPGLKIGTHPAADILCVSSTAPPLQMTSKPILRHTTYLSLLAGRHLFPGARLDVLLTAIQIIMRVSSPTIPFLESYLQAAFQMPWLDVTHQVTDGEDERRY